MQKTAAKCLKLVMTLVCPPCTCHPRPSPAAIFVVLQKMTLLLDARAIIWPIRRRICRINARRSQQMSKKGRLLLLLPPQLILAVPEPMWKLRDALTHADRSPPPPEDLQEVLSSNKGNAKIGKKRERKEAEHIPPPK